MRIAALTLVAMLAFAGNSLLCRMALARTEIDAASFTTIRLVAGALTLVAVVRWRERTAVGGSWVAALALFAYAAGFSYAYRSLPTGTGALILFGAVQITMIGWGLWNGERLRARQGAGLVAALAGLVWLLSPGLESPPLGGAALMLGAGVAWGAYSLSGRGAGEPTAANAGNFLRACVPVAALQLLALGGARVDGTGAGLAVASGALTSGCGYAVWYAALRGLGATTAATVQLTVPVLAAMAGIAFLGEALTVRVVAASVLVLGGVACVIVAPRARRA